ncbi:MAG: ATP-binding protein, partial [Cyanobacteria bacterium J06635_13]
MTYNPFDKLPTEKLTIEDLNQLLTKSVAEGYYVEYKSEFVKNEKIGWSISSFANTYGGWYFVGVEE